MKYRVKVTMTSPGMCPSEGGQQAIRDGMGQIITCRPINDWMYDWQIHLWKFVQAHSRGTGRR